MSSSPKILVFGSTGNIGSCVSASLAKKGVPFRAAVHKVEKAEKIKKLGSNIDIVEVDIYNPASLAKALEGIEKVFLLSPPGHTHALYGVLDAIKKSGTVKHIVKLSALGSEETGGKFIWAEEHTAVEAEINKSGIALTSLRPSSFFTNILNEGSVKKADILVKLPGVIMNWISNEDVGDIAAIALSEPGHEGKTYCITGPDTFDCAQTAQLLSDVLGRTIKYVPDTVEDLTARAKTFMPPQGVNGYVNMWVYFSTGGYNKKFDDAQKLLGKLRNFRDYLEQNKAAL